MIKFDKLQIRARLIMEVGAHLGVPQRIDVPISSIRANFEENGIPFCIVNAATGRDVNDLITATGISPISRYGQLMRLPSRAWVELLITRDDNEGPVDQTWPTDWFEVFNGWVTDLTPSIRLGSSEAVIRITHWVSDLDFCSPYSEDAFPNTPADFLFNAATTTGTGINREIVGSMAVSKAVGKFTAASIFNDCWDDSQGSGIRPFLNAIASERLMNWRQIQAFTGQVGPNFIGTNSLMINALDRFEPFENSVTGEFEYAYGVPLAIRRDILGSPQIAHRIQMQVSLAAYSPTMLGNTIWDRLTGTTAPQFMFCLIPMADRVLTVPYTPWMNNSWATIFSDEYDALEWSIQVRRPIKAVAVVGAYGSFTGMNASKQAGGPVASRRQVLGYYEPPASATNASKDGMTMYVEAPTWINDLLMAGVSSYTAPKDARIPVAANPRSRRPPVDPNFVGPQPFDPLDLIIEDKVASGQSLANALAKATYLQEVTKWRQAVISTSLRFDIAPGSTIGIQVQPDRVLGAILAENSLRADEYMVGRVVRVSWSLDIGGESPSASTVFHLAYIRSLNENSDPSFSAEDHPLWKQIWIGAPLVGLPEFSP